MANYRRTISAPSTAPVDAEVDLEYTPIAERLVPAYDLRTIDKLIEERLALIEARIDALAERLLAVEVEISYVELELPSAVA